MEKIQLKAVEREEFGKGPARRLRHTGEIPGIVYKDGKEGIKLKLDKKALWHALHTEAGGNAIITLGIEGQKKTTQKTVIVKQIQLDPVKDHIIHVDFQEISLKEKIRVKVPLVMKGESIGVKEEKGILNQLEWELDVECLPTDIPEHIEVQVQNMRIGDVIHIKDIAAIEGVRVLGDPEHVVLTVTPPMAEEAPKEATGLEAAGDEPELIKKGKKEEEGEAAEEETPKEKEKEKEKKA